MKSVIKRAGLVFFVLVVVLVSNGFLEQQVEAAVLVKTRLSAIDPHTQQIMRNQSIDPKNVVLYKGYNKDNPYGKDYVDTKTGKHVMEIQQLPMVDCNGTPVDAKWIQNGQNFQEKLNTFHVTVHKNGLTQLTLKNDQSDGRKSTDKLTYQPDLYIGGVKVDLGQPTLLSIDPINENYQNNTLEWVYHNQVKRRLRLIEGQIQGTWVFLSNPNADVTIKYNQTGDFKLKLGQYATDSDTEYVPKAVFDSAEYPLVVDDSQTFYPDKDAESTSVDGWVNRWNVNETWATILAGAGTAFNDSGTQIFGAYPQASTTANQFARNYRSILVFDTHTLGAVIVSAATLSLYAYTKDDGLSCTPTVNVYGSTPASNTGLANGDYANVGSTAYCDTAIAYANWANPAGYVDYNLNATGIAAISLDSVSKFGLRCNYDVTGTQPNWVSGGYTRMIAYQSDYGTGYKPKLVVTYSTASPNISNTPSSHDFGLVQPGTTYYANGSAYSNPVDAGECTFTLTNEADSVAVDLSISITDATGGNTWNVVSTTPSGDEIKYIVVYEGQNPASGLVLSNSPQAWYSNLAVDTDLLWDLMEITGGSGSGKNGTFSDDVEKESTITITASAH